MLKVRVTNMETGVVFEHNDVPREHVEMLKVNPHLKIEVLEIDINRKKRMKRRELANELDN